MTRRDEINQDAARFDAEHPEVWDLFIRFTFDRIRKGFRRYSARTIMERIRWETAVGDPNRTDGFKINDHRTPYYARKFTEQHPQHGGFFELRAAPRSPRYMPELF